MDRANTGLEDRTCFDAYFNQWISAQYAIGKISENSERVYQSMWTGFIAGLLDASGCAIDPLSCGKETLISAVERSTAGSHTSYPKRMAQLVSKVLIHAAMVSAEIDFRRVPIDAFKALPMAFKDNRRKDPVISSLSASMVVAPVVSEEGFDIRPTNEWKIARNIAIASLNVHCGLKMEEIIALNHGDISDDSETAKKWDHESGRLIKAYVVHVRGSRHRQITMPAYAVAYLEDWLTKWSLVVARQPQPEDPFLIGRPLLDQSRKPTGVVTRVSRLTVYRAIKMAMDNISSNQGRNGFIYRQISAGIPTEIVSEWAGFHSSLTIERHARMIPGASHENPANKPTGKTQAGKAARQATKHATKHMTRHLARIIPAV